MSEFEWRPRGEEDAWRPVIDLVDSTVSRRVLVFGSLPPLARDLDLLARPEEEAALRAQLDAAGFTSRGREWVQFSGCSALAVELVPAAAWALPPAELDELFELAIPLDGSRTLVRPAPAHALLIAARRLRGTRRGALQKLRGHVDRALAEEPRAWNEAARRASAWGVAEPLRRLGRLYERRDVALRKRTPRVPRPRRTLVVAFSGLDGSGKSSQAEALSATLRRLGVPAAVVWSPLGGNPLLAAIAVPAKALLRTAPGLRRTRLGAQSARGSVMSSPGAAELAPRRGQLVKAAWATLVMLLNALSQRRAVARRAIRGGVVIFDRHALDSIVRARFLYGSAGGTSLQRLAARVVSPSARFSYYLDVAPDTAFERKPPDWTRAELARQADLYGEEYRRFGARRIDGEREREEICAQVAADVWRALG